MKDYRQMTWKKLNKYDRNSIIIGCVAIAFVFVMMAIMGIFRLPDWVGYSVVPMMFYSCYRFSRSFSKWGEYDDEEDEDDDGDDEDEDEDDLPKLN